MNDLEIPEREARTSPVEHSPHPWWSRLLYLAYGIAVCIGAAIAVLKGETNTAIVAGGIGAVLFWKAYQRRR